MMREYAKLGPTIWTGSTGRQLRKRGTEALVVALYLVSSPASNMLGLYYQPLLYMAHETGLGIDGAQKGLADCIACDFCGYDAETEFVFVYEMAKWQIAEALSSGDKRCIGIQRDYESLPDNPFLGPWFDRYSSAFHLTAKRDGSTSLGLFSQGASQAPSKPGAGTGTGSGKRTSNLPVAPARPSPVDPPQLTLVDPPAPEPTKGLPDCPHLEILALWAEVLPAMPQHLPSQWKGTRADHLRTRWRETAELESWTSQAQGIAYFRKLFRYCGKSQFLTGKAKPREGKPAFTIELEWLVLPSSWAKVLEGKYHATDAA